VLLYSQGDSDDWASKDVLHHLQILVLVLRVDGNELFVGVLEWGPNIREFAFQDGEDLLKVNLRKIRISCHQQFKARVHDFSVLLQNLVAFFPLLNRFFTRLHPELSHVHELNLPPSTLRISSLNLFHHIRVDLWLNQILVLPYQQQKVVERLQPKELITTFGSCPQTAESVQAARVVNQRCLLVLLTVAPKRLHLFSGVQWILFVTNHLKRVINLLRVLFVRVIISIELFEEIILLLLLLNFLRRRRQALNREQSMDVWQFLRRGVVVHK